MAQANRLLMNQPIQSSQEQESKNAAQPSVESKSGASVELDAADADKWFYLDPQNQVQGPFSVEQMAAWFAAGYFSFNLMIKKGSDEKFVPLGKHPTRITQTSHSQALLLFFCVGFLFRSIDNGSWSIAFRPNQLLVRSRSHSSSSTVKAQSSAAAATAANAHSTATTGTSERQFQ